jgi:hypothetical protein
MWIEVLCGYLTVDVLAVVEARLGGVVGVELLDERGLNFESDLTLDLNARKQEGREKPDQAPTVFSRPSCTSPPSSFSPSGAGVLFSARDRGAMPRRTRRHEV